MKSSATKNIQSTAANATKQTTAKKGWLGFLRFVIYFITIIGAFTGASLLKTSSLSSSFADGTASARATNGAIIFTVSIIILSVNIIWGTLRWFLRGQKEHWSPGRIVGKLIGGGLWRAAVVIPLALLALFAITPQIAATITESAQPSPNFTPTSLAENYDQLEYIYQNLDHLTPEKAKESLDGLFLESVRFGTDASSNVSRTKPANPFIQIASAHSTTVTTLNKAQLSSQGHFVIFYTDTGDDAISDQKAAELAEMMEQIIQGYHDNLELDYEYSAIRNNMYNATQMHMVLVNSGIDRNIIDTAMPVYVVNPYSEPTSVLASYAGRKFGELGTNLLLRLGGLFGEETAQLYNSTPSYPFVNILPDNVDSDSLAIVTAHELGHHYCETYIENTYGQAGSNDDFIDETAPNWLAINALPGQPVGNLVNGDHYNDTYLAASTQDKISDASTHYDFDGYPAVAFLQNYADIVPDAKTKIMDAVYHGDALNYLYDQAGSDNFSKVMVSLAEKNLTGDYGGKLYNYTLPHGEDLACNDLCTENYEINPASTQYLYFSTSEYQDATIKFSGNNQTRASVLGRDYNGYWHVLSSGQERAEYTITESTLPDYELIAFAVANADVSSAQNYQIQITAADLSQIISDEAKEGCRELDLDSLFDGLSALLDAGSRSQISAAQAGLSDLRITICETPIASGQSFDSVRSQLQSALGYNFSIFSDHSTTSRVEAFAGIDLLSRRGQIYILAEDSGEIGFITINIAER